MDNKRFFLAPLAAALVAAPLVAVVADTLDVTVTRAPVAPDGTTAGAVTDFVLTFADRDPNVSGIALPVGSTVEVNLPAGFVNTGAGGDNVIILQGWPQSPIIPFPYDIDITGNRITLTLTSDFARGSDGEGGPGPKQVHLLLNSFTNPRPGRYQIPLQIDSATGESYSGVGIVHIIPKARPSVNIVSFLSGGGPPPPFNNPVYQDVALGDDALLTRLFVWDKRSAPFLGIDLVSTDSPEHYRIVRENRTVGHVRITAPEGATDYSLTTMGPSIEVPNPVTLVPTGGLDTQFSPDPTVAGDYVIMWRLNNGNTDRQFIRVL